MGNNRKAKAPIIAARGGACERCGYSRCIRALQFHHQDNSEKREWSKGKGSVSLAELRAHPERFLLLCANCHFEEHEQQDQAKKLRRTCNECGVAFPSWRGRDQIKRDQFCSRSCYHTNRRKAAIAQVSVVPRYWKHVRANDDGCWGWEGTRGGKLQTIPILPVRNATGKMSARPATRVSYEIHFGPIPEHHHVRRTCANSLCTKPEHLALFVGRRKAM